MKSVFAILFSLLLIATQTTLLAGQGEGRPQPCKTPSCCAHCQKNCCLSHKGVPASPASVPAARTLSQTDSQLLMTAHLLFEQSADEPSPVISSVFSVPSMTTVPLYQRNCSFLI